MSYASKIEELIVERDALKLDLALSHANEDEAKRTAAHFKADAERYRKLRTQHWTDNTLTVVRPGSVLLGCDTLSGDRLDAAADALPVLVPPDVVANRAPGTT